MLRNTRGGAMPLVHGPHRVKSSIIEPQDALVNAAFLWALRSANAPASRAGTPASRSSTPLQRCRCSRCAREGRLRASESMGDRGRQRHALASCLVSMPRARIHAKIRRAGAFGQRGGTRLLRHTRGGAMPLVRGPQTQTNRGRPIANECMRPPDAMPRSRSRLYCGRVARAPHLADGHHDERVDLCGAAGIRNDDGTWK